MADVYSEDQRNLIILLSSPLSAFIILTNLFIIVGILCNRKLHNTANYFFLSLLFADFFTGVALPCIPRMRFSKDLSYFQCLAAFISPNFFFLSFLSNLLMVHYEKYLCIMYPLHYRNLWVHRFVPFALLLVWILPLVFACLPLLGWNSWEMNNTCSYEFVFPRPYIYLETYGVVIPSILAIIFITIKMLSVARKQLMDIKKLHRSVQREAATVLERQMNLRYAKCISIVSLTFLVCWVPYIAFLQVSVLAMAQYKISWWIVLITTCVGSGSAAVIPVILGLTNRQYTELYRNICQKYCSHCSKSPKIPCRRNELTRKEHTLDDGLTTLQQCDFQS
ncbi:G-protein coupled bile acid receptor 1 [Bombina bombina]|uniref:G-protein coupled bile acid receptor 1 n=1 Tax=Bombina bombina TaxID=8345 RepID=UPI00235B0580|nr:G-protein coupled bile acid receptor 1 [Bombina bombina]